MNSPHRPTSTIPTAGGLLALVVWSSTVALSTSIMNALGPITGATLIMGIGGISAMTIASLRGQGFKSMLQLDRRYLLGCGAFFVAYMICFYAALGFAPDNPTKLVVGLLNYLWPALLVALSVPILHQPARVGLLILGCAVTLAGTALAKLTCGQASFEASGPLALGLCAGVLWPLYSNFARRWGPKEGGGAVPLFLLISAGLMATLLFFHPETPHISTRQEVLKTSVEMILLAVLSIGISYVLWESGMRKGNNRILGLASYFVPIASMAVATCYWRESFHAGLFAGSALVVVGALISKASLKDSTEK